MSARARPYMTPAQVAALFMVNPVTVRQWAVSGELKAQRTPGGHRRFLPADVEAFAVAHGIPLSSQEQSA